MRRQITMVHQAQAYLEHRRALGFGFTRAGEHLLEFARFLDCSGWRGPLTTDVIWRWIHVMKGGSLGSKVSRLWVVRGFARYLAARDGRTQIPDWRSLPAAVPTSTPNSSW